MKDKYKPDALAKFQPDCFYHVYNRTNNREPLFKNDDDRKWFLVRYKHYLTPYLHTCAYCLMENHFHFMVKIKSTEIITDFIRSIKEPDQTAAHRQFLAEVSGEPDFHPVIERQFTRLFTAYAMRFNERYERKGNLFYRPFKRIEVVDDNRLVWLVYYIHNNPRKHGIFQDFTQYAWSSYASFVSQNRTGLARELVFDLFAGRDNFIAFHKGSESKVTEYRHFEIED